MRNAANNGAVKLISGIEVNGAVEFSGAVRTNLHDGAVIEIQLG